MKHSSQSIETTFGKVTIFKNESDQPKINSRRGNRTQNTSIEQPTKEPVQEPVEKQSKLQKDENPSEIEKNSSKSEDFFGFATSDSKKDQTNELNYFDEQLLKSETPLNLKNDASNNKTIRNEAKTYSKIKENDHLNYIDENFFGELKESSDNKAINRSDESSLRKIDKNDIDKLDDLNYIDQVAFQKPNQDNQTSELGSLSSIKLKKEKKKKSPSEKIPIVQSNNLNEENIKHLKNPNLNNQEKEIVSNHKALEKEVPKWNYITLDEAVKFLKNHVCYLNENG